MSERTHDAVAEFLSGYCEAVRVGLRTRWVSYKPEIYNNEASDALGGLAARQATLAIEFAQNPGIWNGHIAPIILRCMTDTHITLAWILGSPLERSKDYIRFGLGQEKLFIEYLENEADSAPEGELDERVEKMIEVRKSWLNSQLMEWAIEVNVGSWAGKSTRDMATESGCESLYKFAYVPFSGAAHSMWQHVGIYNTVPCQEPLHKHHRLPITPELAIDPDFLYRSAKYVSRTYQLLDEKLRLQSSTPLPVAYFIANQPFSDKGGHNEEA